MFYIFLSLCLLAFVLIVIISYRALGISCIQLAEMAPPHSDQNPMRALLLITTSDPPTLKQPEKWSKSFNSFLAKALTKEPSDRPR